MYFRILVVVTLAACADTTLSETEEAAICTTCGSDNSGGGTGLPTCSSTCSSTADCTTKCTSGSTTTSCGGYGVCRSCTTCSASVSCATSCRTGTGFSTCGTGGNCRKYDVYCAYPVFLDDGVSDDKESYFDGPTAYMYFESAATEPKSGTFASSIGGYAYDPYGAWASNFRGPWPVDGKTARTQWEFSDTLDRGYHPYMYASFGDAGAPYLYGQGCLVVSPGAAAPSLGAKNEHVYENDECKFGICNADDYVGSFTIDRTKCDAVFGAGNLTGWTGVFSANPTTHINWLDYKVWCYSCRNSPTPNCSAGVVQ